MCKYPEKTGNRKSKLSPIELVSHNPKPPLMPRPQSTTESRDVGWDHSPDSRITGAKRRLASSNKQPSKKDETRHKRPRLEIPLGVFIVAVIKRSLTSCDLATKPFSSTQNLRKPFKPPLKGSMFQPQNSPPACMVEVTNNLSRHPSPTSTSVDEAVTPEHTDDVMEQDVPGRSRNHRIQITGHAHQCDNDLLVNSPTTSIDVLSSESTKIAVSPRYLFCVTLS